MSLQQLRQVSQNLESHPGKKLTEISVTLGFLKEVQVIVSIMFLLNLLG